MCSIFTFSSAGLAANNFSQRFSYCSRLNRRPGPRVAQTSQTDVCAMLIPLEAEVKSFHASAAVFLRPQSASLRDHQHPAGRDRARLFSNPLVAQGPQSGPAALPAARALAASRCNSAYWPQEVRMSEMIIRPTMKFIYLGYADRVDAHPK